jgi:hypothetical protein
MRNGVTECGTRIQRRGETVAPVQALRYGAAPTEVQSIYVANEPNDVLMRILQEVLDSRRVLGEGIDGVGGHLDSFRNDTLTNFDAAFRRLENVEFELHAVSAALTRLE